VRDRHSTDGEVLRLTGPIIFWWVWLAFVAANVVDYAVQGLPSAHFSAVVAAILLLVTGLVYTLALRPKVIVSGDGLTVLNPYRTHRVPWRLIHSVDTAEWVQVHYAPGGATDSGVAAAGAGASYARAGGSSAGDKTLHCWALYVSTRARFKINQVNRLGRQPSVTSRAARAAESVGYARPSAGFSDEARYLTSLPVAKAYAVRLDTRATRERAKAGGGTGDPGQEGMATATATWSWLALAAVALPALILLIVALA
jgi:Bacterial PH domain